MSYLSSQFQLFSVQYYLHKESGQLIYKAESGECFFYGSNIEC